MSVANVSAGLPGRYFFKKFSKTSRNYTIYCVLLKCSAQYIEEKGRVCVKCPYCGYADSRVVDSRATDEGSSIRRRRECLECGRRFTTYEVVEDTPLVVIKKDGRRMAFDRSKLLNGLVKACEKRPVPLEKMEDTVNLIEKELRNSPEREVPSRRIGELLMKHLKELDQVAYVRFASVYREFKDIDQFVQELDALKKAGA